MAKKQFTGTATYESPKDKTDAKSYKEMKEAKSSYFEQRGKDLQSF